MPSRRERAIERMKVDKYYGITPGFRRQIEDVIECYEAELAADLESEETVERAVRAYLNPAGIAKVIPTKDYARLLMRAALKAALGER